MKKITIILIAILFFSFSFVDTYAQDYKSTVSVGAGSSLLGLTLKGLALKDIKDGTTSQSDIQNSTYKSVPVLQLSYDLMLAKIFSIGVAGSYQHFNFDNKSSDEYLHVKRSNVAIRGLFHYGNGKRIDMYSGVRLGATIWNTDFKIKDIDTDPTLKELKKEIDDKLSGIVFAPQLVAFGFRGYFTNNIGVFAELSVGAPAFLTAGLNFRF